VAVSPGDRVTVPPLVIEVGATEETITVSADAPLIQAQSGERSFTVTTTAVEALPIVTRNFANLAALTPGTLDNERLGGGGQNNVMIDGVSSMDTGSNGQNLQLNIDAIAEVKILTSGYQAEYGRSSGLQITAVTRSGTNRFRGSPTCCAAIRTGTATAGRAARTASRRPSSPRVSTATRSAGRWESRADRTSSSSSTAWSSGRGRRAASWSGCGCRPRPSGAATSRSRSTTRGRRSGR